MSPIPTLWGKANKTNCMFHEHLLSVVIALEVLQTFIATGLRRQYAVAILASRRLFLALFESRDKRARERHRNLARSLLKGILGAVSPCTLQFVNVPPDVPPTR